MEETVSKHIAFSPPDISELEIAEVADALRSGWITTGPRTKKLEANLAEYIGVNKTVCLNSATAAEELIMRVIGITEGDEVIVPAYTYTASASAAIHAGAKIVFVDIKKDGDEVTHAPFIDYDKIADAITEKTKAVVAVDLGGVMCDYDKIYEAVESKKSLFKPVGEIQEKLGRVAVIADCAHGLGASRNGVMAGAVADFTSFSFHAVKNFTTAEGGAAAWRNDRGFDDEAIYKQMQLLSLHGQNKDALAKTKAGAWEYDIIGPWYKCNMTDIMAAIGLKQFERYPGLLARRKEIIARYDAACDRIGVEHINHYGSDYASSGHLYLTRIPGITTEARNEIIVKMSEAGVATNVHYKPLPMMTAYRNLGWDIKDFPNSYDYYHNLITLPLHTLLTDEDVDYVIAQWERIVKEYI